MTAREIPHDTLAAHVGEALGYSSWVLVTQENVDAYAVATNDHQWFCEDPERARRESPYGGTVAPGYFLLALVPGMLKEIWYVTGARMAVNYGIERLRFPAPLRVGDSARLHASLAEITPAPGATDVRLALELEAKTQTKPVCVAEGVYRFFSSPE